jgi:hypothetical protein
MVYPILRGPVLAFVWIHPFSACAKLDSGGVGKVPNELSSTRPTNNHRNQGTSARRAGLHPGATSVMARSQDSLNAAATIMTTTVIIETGNSFTMVAILLSWHFRRNSECRRRTTNGHSSPPVRTRWVRDKPGHLRNTKRHNIVDAAAATICVAVVRAPSRPTASLHTVWQQNSIPGRVFGSWLW